MGAGRMHCEDGKHRRVEHFLVLIIVVYHMLQEPPLTSAPLSLQCNHSTEIKLMLLHQVNCSMWAVTAGCLSISPECGYFMKCDCRWGHFWENECYTTVLS